MPSLRMPAPLKNISKSDEIGIHIGVGFHGRMSDTGLRREMRHIGESLRSEQPRHGTAVGDIASLETKIHVRKQLCESRFLETRVVIVIEVVDADDTPAFGGEPAREMKSDEPSRAGHKDGLTHAASARGGRWAAAEKIAFDQPAYGMSGHNMNLLDQRRV